MININEFDTKQKNVQLAAKLTYTILGFSVAAWATLIPYAKENLNVQEGILGLLLLCLGAGAVCAMPFSGALASRYGCRKVLALLIPIFLICLVLLSIIDNVWLFALTLAIFGIATGIVDVVMNIQGVFIEQAHNKNMMSGFHAMYSIGGVLGSGLMAAMLSMGLSPFVSCAILAISGCIIVLIFAVKYFLPYGDSGKKAASIFVIPQGLILILSILCFMLYMNEGVVLDWSGLFLTQERGIEPAHAAISFAVFSATTALGRLAGDRLVQMFGVKKLLIGGGFLAAMGHGLVLGSNSFTLALIGFGIIGLGAANMIPQLFSLSGSQKAIPLHVAIATVTTIGYAGLLVGPAFMGFVAELTGLPSIFAIMAVLLIIVGIISTRIQDN